ncbi:glycosyltransferase [Vibrio campbellii]|uniref:glycosyltransferase n=1 Tax=Vibrio campbellii TaxID=680 RepID=UPI0037365A8B
MKVLHVLYTYLPDVTGSSIRSEGILKGQKSNGIDVVVITSPFQKGYRKDLDVINDVKVYRTYNNREELEASENRKSIKDRIIKIISILGFSFDVYKVAKKENINVIHAHSMFFCGLPAFLCSKVLNVKFVYEYRSVWEDRFDSVTFFDRFQNKVVRFLETLSMKLADKVVVLNEGLRRNVIDRGITSDKVVIVPNAVSDDLFLDAKDITFPLSAKSFGYVGNFSHIEGLDLLVKAFLDAFPRKDFSDCKLTFHGRGPYLNSLEELLETVDDDRILIAGPFERGHIIDVYKSLDCIVIPRRKLNICDVVTPLKPLEAMAFGRLVIGSNCGGIVEVCASERNAVLFEADSIGSLSLAMKKQYESFDLSIAKNGRDFVENNRNWSDVAKIYFDVY